MPQPSDDPKQLNSNPESDMAQTHHETFIAPLMRVDGLTDEMTLGFKIQRFLLPTPVELQLTSADGTVFNVTVANDGTLSATPI